MRVKNCKLLCAGLLAGSMMTTAYATAEGMYFGASAGQSTLNNTSKNITINPSGKTVSVNPTNTGVGGRLFVGYQLGNYMGMEMGWNYFSPSKYSVTGLPGNALCNDPTVKVLAVDFLGKGILPIYTTGFDVFAKAGFAIARQTQSGSLVTTTGTCGGNNSVITTVLPEVAFGVSYDITQSWVADVTVSQIFHGKGIPNSNMLTLGIAYHIVDKMCGQFLC